MYIIYMKLYKYIIFACLIFSSMRCFIFNYCPSSDRLKPFVIDENPCPLRSDVLQGDLLVFRHFLLILHWILGLNYINVLYFVGWLK